MKEKKFMENSWTFMLENYGNYDNFFQKTTLFLSKKTLNFFQKTTQFLSRIKTPHSCIHRIPVCFLLKIVVLFCTIKVYS